MLKHYLLVIAVLALTVFFLPVLVFLGPLVGFSFLYIIYHHAIRIEKKEKRDKADGDKAGDSDIKVQGSIVRKNTEPAPVVTSVATAPVKTDVAEEIRKFAELRDAGHITEEEFTAKKKQLLGI